MFGVKKYQENSFCLFGPKDITFGNILTQKYRTYLPVCACAECPPPWGADTEAGISLTRINIQQLASDQDFSFFGANGNIFLKFSGKSRKLKCATAGNRTTDLLLSGQEFDKNQI